MAFPASVLPIKGQMQIDGVWTDVTTRVRNESDITITGGFAPEQTTLTPVNIAFTLNNRDGLFTDDNPASPYYGLLPVNTPFRVGVDEPTTFLRQFNEVNANPLTSALDSGWIQTDDKATLDVTGDLDLRIEIDPDVWSLGAVGHQLASKYTPSGNQRSWAWSVQANGRMRLYWSADGNNAFTNGTYADSTVRVPATGRIALRVTIDVNNGAAGRTITFYTSTSITGTWTQLGDPVVQAGTTSIFSSSSKVSVGGFVDSATAGFAFITDADAGYTLPLAGRIYRFQMYNGIGGTLVADMNAVGQPDSVNAAHGWIDMCASPNTWVMQRDDEVKATDYRATGEISEMPQEWDITGTDIYIPTSANGIMRRITQGASPLKSPIFRNLSQFIGAGALGYWPLEGGSQTTSAGNAVPRGNPAVVSNVLFQSDEALPGTAGVMTLNDASSYIRATSTTIASTDLAFLIFYVKIPTVPGGSTEIMSVVTTSTRIRRVTVSATSTLYGIDVYDSTGTNIGALYGAFGALGAPGQWLAFEVKMVKNSTSVDVNLAWFPIGTRSNFYGITLNITSAVVGTPTTWYTNSGAASLGCSFAHVMFGNLVGWSYAVPAFAQSSVGYDGERAITRYLRVCQEEGVQARCIGWPEDSEPMGPQPTAKLVDILDECIAVDGGMQFEARDQAALVARTRSSLYGQDAITLDYSLNHLSGSFRPVADDRLLRNDVTVQRPTGSFANVRRETGPKSVLPPPNGVGPYDVALTRNASSDSRLPDLAGWEVGIGTWPDRRVPNIEVWLQRSVFVVSATLTRQMRWLHPGARIQVLNPPVWVGGVTQDAMVRGYVERLKNRGHELAFSTVPYGPYDAARYDDPDTSRRARYDVRTSTLQASMTSSDTLAQTVSASRRGFWSWKSIPYNIKISGQVNTVLGATRPDSISQQDTSFETGTTTGWASAGGALTSSTAQKPYGTRSLLLTVSGSPATGAMSDDIGAIAVAGGVYQVIAWVYVSVTRTVGWYIDWYTSGAAFISTSAAETTVTANTWTEIGGNLVAPATTGFAYQGLYMGSSPANGTLLYAKNLDLLRIDVRNQRQVLLLTRGSPTKALSSGAEVHIEKQRGWAL